MADLLRGSEGLLPFIPLALIVVNFVTIALFYLDKRSAIAGARRVPEARLLSWAAMGGTPGAFLARHLFRHKTRKEPFTTRLQLIAVVQVGLLIGVALW
ncbi:DUF1294 domain-containing protein [Croceicoccus mobilis]|uniref:Cold-shock protein n=1 Tax=Croceicoccus mobilis TaxID=1703339 RepID=A0A916YUT5_9SPHN|nr:DUF1294 domain-containing protein [Croceicoccus mobilis]GGD61417.1 hypothetical protein GCM10010990_08650 [Croceicoccus mobilis]